MSEILRFETNKPLEVALAYPDGKEVEGRYGNQILYSLMEPPDHVMYLHPTVGGKIRELGIGRGERFEICKAEVRKPGAKKPITEWQVIRVDPPKAAEPVAAGPAADATNGHHNHPNGNSNGNGHNGGYTNGRALNPNLPIPPSKIPMNVAVVEVIQMVREAMVKTGEQWGDQAKQDLCSTLLIQAGKEGWLGPWERGGAK